MTHCTLERLLIVQFFFVLISLKLQVRSATLDTWLPEQVAFIHCKISVSDTYHSFDFDLIDNYFILLFSLLG